MVIDFGKKYSELARAAFCFMIKTISGGKQFEILFLCQFGKCNRVKNRHIFRYYTVFALGVRSLGWVPASICPSKILLKTFLWHHLVAKFPGNACGLTLWATWWPNFQQLQVVPAGGQISC